MAVAVPPVRVALVNDYELVVWGLAKMLEPFGDRVKIVELNVDTTPDHDVDIALIDAFGAEHGGLEMAEQTLAQGNASRVAIYTWHADPPLVEQALELGVSGYLSKSISGGELVQALERIADGEQVVTNPFPRRVPSTAWPNLPATSDLTEREAEILALLSAGLTNSQIGDRLYVSTNTVKTYLKRVYRKLQVTNRAQAAIRAAELGLRPRVEHVELPSSPGGSAS
jgi:DNA-binding NarL/FixJ family response regulator